MTVGEAEGPEDERIFKVFILWELDCTVTVIRNVIGFNRTYDIQMNDMIMAIRKVNPSLTWDDIRLYGRIGSELMRIRNYVTLHCALVLMSACHSDILYIVKISPEERENMTLEDVMSRRHVVDLRREIKDQKMIFANCKDDGCEGSICPLRVEHFQTYSQLYDKESIASELPESRKSSTRKKKK